MIEENSIVQYKGKGAYMTVIELRGTMAVCAWYGPTDLHEAIFPIKHLTLL